MTLVDFKRLSDASPPVRELLVVDDDGQATAWRSNGPAVGRFAGPVADLAGLTAAVGAARAAEPAPVTLRADAVVEVIETGGRQARVPTRLPVEGPWGPLAEACRGTLDAMTASPAAAIAGSLGPGARLVLEHRGGEPLPLELASLEVTFKRWRDGVQAGEARVRGAGEALDRVEAGPGWSLEIGAGDAAGNGTGAGDGAVAGADGRADGLDLAGGGILVAEAVFVAEDAGVYVPVRLSVSTTL